MKARIIALAERRRAISRQIKAERSRPSGGWTDNLARLKRLRLALKDELQRLRGRARLQPGQQVVQQEGRIGT
ncbi:YdcH family protein [Pacificimonas sp. WHA3]|uniref:YdcH family protein n=1 Tax=Pacificimonas pallii TaxID=2827236 RepID=A0ABS6SHN5_9SPHN|nr:YdcH family protein [Pacificimonas pallii]MBV7257929.1 YdcH family protein [Pacificimonas pallii]